MNGFLKTKIDGAITSMGELSGAPVELGIVLGSGLGGLADKVQGAVRISYLSVPGMASSTAPGHVGQFVIGELSGVRCALMQGRIHLYEGRSAQEVAFPIYLLRAMGAKSLVVTNAAGALNPDFAPGDVMLIEDHLNLTGANPLIGDNDESVGLRFPDMSRAYDPEWRELAISAGGPDLRRGIYAGITGPSLETSAERRFLRNSGGDAVGMSTVVEVIAAVHAGLRVLGLSAVTNSATGGVDQQPDTIEEVLANAAIAGEKIATLLEYILPRMAAPEVTSRS
ncbi:purine-nucleoside phosphorylase [Amaricoccus macauensis]|uniref:purine-nucleoside phosphorylase n=1 Tax=Amaricoccus macauensis TaxID=57001 RepID=UPI003C79ED4B